MNLLQEVQKIAVKKVPKIEPGLTVRVHQKIREGEKERIQIFEGLVIKVNSGHGADKTFTVRKVVEGIGVEKVFPLYSAAIEKIEVLKKSKIRRAKLYYMRERSGKSARLKETFVKNKAEEEEEVVVETAEAPEAPEANETPEAAVEPAEVQVEPAEAEAPEAESPVEDKAEEDKKE